MLARLVIAVSPSCREPSPQSFESQPEHPARVALVDLRLLLVGGPHARHGRDRVTDEPRTLLGIEGHVGPEEDVVGPEERQPGLHRVPGAEEGGVAVEHPEVVDRALPQARERAHVLGIVAPASELIQRTWARSRACGSARSTTSGCSTATPP